MGQLFQFNTANDFIATVDYVANTALKAQFLKFNNLDQARQLAMTAITRGLDMLEVCLAFDIIGGRLSKKSAAMLAEYKARGGKYKILSRTADLASIEYTYEGQTQVFSLSWDQVQLESYCYEKDGKTLKPRYATPHSRSQMMWARVVSDSVRTIMPEVTGGYYTPEEMQDVIDGECTTVPNVAGSLPAPASPAPGTEPNTQATMQVANAQVDDMISPEQVTKLNGLFVACKLKPENIANSLAKRNASKVEELTAIQATEIIDALTARLAAISAPISPELDSKIQEAIKLRAQEDGGLAIVDACKIHLETHGLGIHQLTTGDAQRLLAAIEQANVKLFISEPLSIPGKA